MTILISAFGVAGRFAGDLLMTALGWASSLLFGRVPRTHQIFVVLMMALSFLWIVAVVALAAVIARYMPARTSARDRVNSYAVWATVVFILNVLAFLLMGLQTRDILRKLDGLLSKSGFARTDVRDLLVYVTDEEAATRATAECRAGFAAHVSITPVKVALAAAGARVEIMTLAERG